MSVQVIFADAPQITPGGVVNGASYAQPIAPGAIASIFGTNLADALTVAPGAPFPLELGGTSVTVNGIKAPLYFVSPSQVNIQVPSSLEQSITAYTTATVVVTTAGGSSVPVEATLYSVSPAPFTLDFSGCGPAAALNVAADGSVSLNSTVNSAAPGDYISIYLTGLGLPSVPIADGNFGTGADSVQIPGVWIDGVLQPSLQYAGLAPLLVGVNQINVQIPPGTREGCAIPIAVGTGALLSPTVSVSINAQRGRCVDPPIQSYGQMFITKSVASGTNADGSTETLTATFPSGPGLKPLPEVPVTLGAQIDNVTDPTTGSRSCKVAGNESLSAGTIAIQASGAGEVVTAQPVQDVDGVTYRQALPPGFVLPGNYTLSASGGPVTYRGRLSVGAPIQIQTVLTAGTAISTSKPLTISWTGGTAGNRVKVMLVSALGVWNPYDYGYVDAETGSFTFQPFCTGFHPVVCSVGLPTGGTAQVVVELSPAPESVTTFPAQGITGSVQASWSNRYVFGGLVFAP
ncbi:MAG: hypothetical protein ABI693_16530 [Bryobacteraceae bacterium]